MKKWQILAPLGLAAAGAAALLLKRKPAKAASPAPKAAPAAKKAPAPKAPEKLEEGSYSFISGFQNASTVEMSLSYDPERFRYAVVEGDFLSYSSDSHVAILEGEDFSLQIEYAAYYSGEDYAAHCKGLQEKYSDFAPARYGRVDCCVYLEGDNVCFCLPIPEDAHSYVQVILFKAKGNDTELIDMPADPDLTAILSSIRFRKV